MIGMNLWRMNIIYQCLVHDNDHSNLRLPGCPLTVDMFVWNSSMTHHHPRGWQQRRFAWILLTSVVLPNTKTTKKNCTLDSNFWSLHVGELLLSRVVIVIVLTRISRNERCTVSTSLMPSDKKNFINDWYLLEHQRTKRCCCIISSSIVYAVGQDLEKRVSLEENLKVVYCWREKLNHMGG